jgi:hypothetical protein
MENDPEIEKLKKLREEFDEVAFYKHMISKPSPTGQSSARMEAAKATISEFLESLPKKTGKE